MGHHERGRWQDGLTTLWRGVGMNGLRWTMIGTVLALLLFMGGLSSAGGGAATDLLKGTIDEVLKILSDKELKDPARHEDRRQRLEKVVAARFDYPEMSRRSLGTQWNQLSDKDKQEFVDLFRTLLTNTYADKVETYSGKASNTSTSGQKKNMRRCAPKSYREKLKFRWIIGSCTRTTIGVSTMSWSMASVW